MKKYSIYDIKGGEILANPIVTSIYHVVLPEGTVLRKEYVENFKHLGITEVYIFDEKEKIKGQETQITKNELIRKEIEDTFNIQIKNILEKYVYLRKNDLEKLSEIVNKIIDHILKQKYIFGEMIEIKDKNKDIYEHSLNCCTLAIILGLKLKFERSIIHKIGIGCLLHDIGLKHIPIDYFNRSDFSKMQINEYKKHPIYGYSSVENEEWLDPISRNIILYHHERLDGTGYPFHKKYISETVGVVSVCDIFDEMVSGMCYKEIKVCEAIEYIKTFKNVRFNGRIVDEFLKMIAVYPIGSHVLTNRGEMGIVIRQNKGFPDRPVLHIRNDRDGRESDRKIIIDLSKEKSVYIESVVD